jgi:mannose-1-phosphate guanylyltransferase
MIDPMTPNPTNLWGLVLAGGEGQRLQDYVRELRGECLPKQYVNFVGTRSMLEHTLDRVERLIPRPRVLTVVTEHHLLAAEVRRQLANRTPGTVIVQPENKDTGLGILLPLIYLHRRCPDATVAVFPSDHFVLEEDRFLDHAALAVRATRHDPEQIVILAMEPHRAEPEYGYVVPTESNGHIDLCGCRHAAHFVEKPAEAEARLLVASGALWNTMILVFRIETLLGHVEVLYPEVASLFKELSRSIGTPAEKNKVREVYGRLRPLNFSKDLLEKIAANSPSSISVLPVLHVTWSDWGSPQRLREMKQVLNRLPKAHQTNRPSAPVRRAPASAPPLPSGQRLST